MRVISKLNECTPYNLSKYGGNLYKGVKNVGNLCLFADMAVSLSPIRVYKIPNFPNLGLLRPFWLARAALARWSPGGVGARAYLKRVVPPPLSRPFLSITCGLGPLLKPKENIIGIL